MAKILGIDLGTTFSAMAAMKDGDATIIENKEGNRTTPSVVAINDEGERLVGTLARRQQVTNPGNTIFGVKRLIGRRYSDSVIQKYLDNLPYKTRESDDGGIEIKMGDNWYKPPQVSAMVLEKLKKDAEDKLGEEVEKAIITCPAYFDDSQRKATKVAGEIAGFDVERVINEPTAAALAYGLTEQEEKTVVVYDFGGGTFDISILEVSEDTVEVKGTGGDTHLGGNDFDQEIIDWLVGKFKKEQGIDLSQDELALQRLKEAAEKAKIELSSTKETDINLPYVTSDDAGAKHLNYKMTRAKLENLVKDYIDKSMDLVEETLKESELTKGDVDDIVLVGGQTRMPAIQERIKEFFGMEPEKNINPDEVVAIGAATQAGIMEGDVKDVLLLDVTPLSLGIETLGGKNTTIIEKNTTIPTSESEVFSTATDNQSQVEINVLQGERPTADDCKSLGRFILDGIPPAPRGVPKIEVTFDIDANGILHVSAEDQGTGKSQSIRIEDSLSLSDEEIEKMKEEAKKHREEDKKKEELIEKKNEAENLIYTCKNTLEESGDKIDDETKQELKDKIKELKEAKEDEDLEKIKEKSQSLSEAMQKISSEIYGQQGAAQGGPQAQGGPKQQGPQDADQQDPEAEESEDDEQ